MFAPLKSTSFKKGFFNNQTFIETKLLSKGTVTKP